MSDRNQKPLRRVGVLWKPKPGGKSLGSGSLTINGLRQRFIVLRNDRKPEGSKDPDYLLMSSDDVEPDTYTPRQSAPPSAPRSPASADPF